LHSFGAILASSAELRHALASPAVSSARKRTVISRIADQLQLSQIARNFLYVLNSHRRLDALEAVLESFDVLSDERLGFTRAHVTSAQELDAGQRSALEAELAKLTGKRVRLKFATDPGLIGGLVARIGSTVYDGSLKRRLQSLGRQLMAE
jgi:F-type H+-transporting ATPase subunit delta